MGFKKTSIKKKSPLILNLTGMIAVASIFMLGFLILQNIDFINLDIGNIIEKNSPGNNNKLPDNSNSVLNEDEIDIIKNDKKNDKEKKYKTNILIVGRGGVGHEAPNLTDTIILASINSKEKIVSMLSIPRDLYVEYEEGDSGKINQIYALKSHKTGSRDKGMIAISKKISEISGEEIDFYANVDFNGFKKIIDVLGGIELTIPKQFVDNSYPDGNRGYKTIVFKKGTWVFDGENALKYARSRHSTSDFDRSLRQQQIISAIRNKLTASYLITSPLKVKELYDVFKEYIFTDISLNDMIKLALNLKVSDYKIQSFNLNDSCFYGTLNCQKGGFLYIPNREYYGGASVLLPEGALKNNLGNYKIIHKYTNLIFNNPDLFVENYKINIFNSVKVNFLASILADEVKKYGFNVPEKNSIGNTQNIYKESIIYYNNIEASSKTLKTLKEFYPELKFLETKGPKYSKELDTKIEIIIGEDYKKIFNLK